MGPVTDFGSARISDHARTAPARREITEAQVRQVLRAPQAVVPGNRRSRSGPGPGDVGRFAARVLLRVVVEVGQDSPEAVTVYATTRFRRYGARP